MSETLFERLAAESGAKLASDADIKVLKQLQKEWESAREVISHCGVDGAYACWLSEQQKAVLAARAAKLHEIQTRSREQVEEDFLRKGAAAREHQRQVSQAAIPLARKAAEKFAEAAHDVAAGVEKAEAAIYAHWGVAYKPSPLVIALRQLADAARRQVPSSEYASASPASMVPFLPL